ncbi:hypothetical protein A8W25_11630 [Streptomyces sp. ERV7]|uniref:COG1470 family protein n=1 Tax=Streptomyces sp. ERV7 TaxID=1322334 RepID=UPI0007F39915|nr:hypothetical protein [Streptomyces sp. ERV7]OAR26536.1 hypothetical protein A8W25_11630 [Streptomyces sp. ERV7]
MPPRPLRLAVFAAALALTALSAPAARAAEGEWSAAPASGGGSRPSGDGRPYFYLEGAPGSVLEDRLSLTNPTGRPLTLRLRGAGAYNTPTGAFAVRPGADPWLALASGEVRIPARTRAEVPFAVTVPAGAAPGDHPAALVASGGGREAGVRVQVRVAGPVLPALTVEDVRLDKSRSLIRYALVNRGNTTLAPRLAVRADGFFGQRLRRPARALPVELLPGRRVELTEPWRPPALDRVEVRLTAAADGAAPSEASASAVSVPWGPVAGAGCVAAGAGAALWLRRRRRRAGPGEPEEPEPVSESATTGAAS